MSREPDHGREGGRNLVQPREQQPVAEKLRWAVPTYTLNLDPFIIAGPLSSCQPVIMLLPQGAY